jgi:hypothetical protein
MEKQKKKVMFVMNLPIFNCIKERAPKEKLSE